MKLVAAAAIIALTWSPGWQSPGLLVADDAVAEELEVRHADLRITLPAKPIKDVKQMGGEDGREPSQQHRLIINEPQGTIIVWYQDSPHTTDPEPALRAARDTIVGLAGGEIRLDKAIEKDEHPGRYITVSIPEKKGEFRVAYFFAAGRFYQIMAVGTEEYTHSASINRLFESVRFAEAAPATE